MKVNLGCGRNKIDGFVNIDRSLAVNPDLVVDLDDYMSRFWCKQVDNVTEWLGIDFIEHVSDTLGLMQWMWERSVPGALCGFELPYGSSDDAWEDPTHVRPYFIGSWGYFGQPFYWRADYGYEGDWRVVEIELWTDCPLTVEDVMQKRNVVKRQRVTLEAVKPARPADRSLIEPPVVKLVRV